MTGLKRAIDLLTSLSLLIGLIGARSFAYGEPQQYPIDSVSASPKVSSFSSDSIHSALPVPDNELTMSSIPNLPLRYWANQRSFKIGAAVSDKALTADILYRWKIASEFNLITAENAMKFSALQPIRGQYTFNVSDQIMDFAQAYNMQVRGHTLVWHNSLPSWLTENIWSHEESISLLRQHIQTVVDRYRGEILAWDVVNEAVANDGSLRDTFWLQQIGPEYIELAFRWAHEADPTARLFYNDYGGEGLGAKSDAIYSLLQELIQDDVPVHGVGLQMHVSVENPPDPSQVTANIERLSQLGLEIHITEMDVRVPLPANEQILEQQALVYRSILDICLSNPSCTTFVMWGFSDRYSWVPKHFPGQGSALILDENFRPKPAYDALIQSFIDR